MSDVINKWRVCVIPSLEGGGQSMELVYPMRVQAMAASDAMASLLLFLQDTVCVMPEHSNVFWIEELVEGEWLAYEEDEEEEE